MIEKITQANVTSVSSGKKQGIQNISAPKTAADETGVAESSQQTSVSKISTASSHLPARDVQANISYQQLRGSALLDVNNMLKDLRNLAMQYGSGDLSLQEQDAIVAKAEQTLYAIDQTASTVQFQGTPVVSDADSRELGLEVINLESGDPVGLINSAIKKVAAKLAMNNAQMDTSDVRIDNIRKSAPEIISEFQAEQTAKSIANAIQNTPVDDIHGSLGSDKVISLLGI